MVAVNIRLLYRYFNGSFSSANRRLDLRDPKLQAFPVIIALTRTRWRTS
jgi:hypothetical protein